MKEAVEVCKLRLFLSLASSALERQELEPLPNIYFNIMNGNSLVGILKEEKTGEQLSLFSESYTQLLGKYKRSVEKYKTEKLSFEKLKALKEKTNDFIKESAQSLNKIIVKKCHDNNVRYEILNIKKKVDSRRPVNEHDIEGLEPFHWDFSFHDIIEQGGFDIILTNPPWDKVQLSNKEFIKQYDKNLKVNNTSTQKAKKILTELLQKKQARDDYIGQNSSYFFQSNYFKKNYKHQSGKIINSDSSKKRSSSHTDTYRVFLERCIDLLKQSGRVGIVLPSGFGRDDGSVGLRKFIFNKVKIEGLIDFQNQGINGKIFDDVHPQFTFGLLNIKRDKPKDEFPCRFGEKNLKVLEFFPRKDEPRRSIKKIKKRSPRDCSIIEFKHPMDESILEKAEKFPTLGETIENLWNVQFYQEFNETNDKPLFKVKRLNNDHFPLYKGGAIYQYEYNFDREKSNRHVNKNTKKIKSRGGFAFGNKCYKNYRLVIRDVARATDERSLISAVIPRNCFFTNTLWGVYIDIKNSKKNYHYMLLLQSFLNSFTLDYLIRKRIACPCK